jgi:fluoroacetyl-CoA thioesterase
MEIPISTKGYAEKTVETTDTAISHGSGRVEVFATPAMIALMEMAAHTSIDAYLDHGFLSVGTEISIKHLKATRPGTRVWAESILTSVEGNKLSFEISAFDTSGQIGSGTHTRFVVNKEKFMGKI